MLPESPESRGVWYLAGSIEPKEAGEGIPIENLKLQGLIGQVVQRLQDERLEQQNDIKPLGTSRRFLFFFPGLLKRWPKHFPVNGSVDLVQRITDRPYQYAEDERRSREIQVVSCRAPLKSDNFLISRKK